MDYPLTGYRVLRFPFCPQAFCLCRLTDRAITLLSIKTIKRMAIFTKCFLSVLRWNRLALAQCVFSPRRQTQVLDSHTIPMTTNMVHDHSLWDVAKVMPIHHAMRPSALSPKKENAISIRVFLSVVNQAVSLTFGFSNKSAVFSLRHCHVCPQD